MFKGLWSIIGNPCYEYIIWDLSFCYSCHTYIKFIAQTFVLWVFLLLSVYSRGRLTFSACSVDQATGAESNQKSKMLQFLQEHKGKGNTSYEDTWSNGKYVIRNFHWLWKDFPLLLVVSQGKHEGNYPQLNTDGKKQKRF